MSRPTQDLLDNLTSGTTGARVTIDDVVVASAGWLTYAITAATVGYLTGEWFLSVASPLILLAFMAGSMFLDYKIYKASTPPTGLMALSLGTYGYVVGGISYAYSHIGGGGLGLIGSAALGTVVTAAVVIGLYKARILRADTPKFRSVVIAASLGYALVIGASLLIQAFGGGSLFGSGILGWALCLIGATLAALSLTIAAADIDRAITAGMPRAEASRLAWAFVSTLLWLYLEILRLLSRMRN